jgi:hypothetical protein
VDAEVVRVVVSGFVLRIAGGDIPAMWPSKRVVAREAA